jgi:hypothetical protein
VDAAIFLGVAAIVVAIAIPLWVERLKRPRLGIIASQWVAGRPVPWTFAAVQVQNRPLSGALGALLTREVAQGCRVQIDFLRWGTDERAIDTVQGRWSSHPDLRPASPVSAPSSWSTSARISAGSN